MYKILHVVFVGLFFISCGSEQSHSDNKTQGKLGVSTDIERMISQSNKDEKIAYEKRRVEILNDPNIEKKEL